MSETQGLHIIIIAEVEELMPADQPVLGWSEVVVRNQNGYEGDYFMETGLPFSPSKEDPESETKKPPPMLPQGPKTRLSRPAGAPNCNGTTGPPPTWCTLDLGAGEWDPKNSVEFCLRPAPKNGRDEVPREFPCSWGLGFQYSPDTRPGMAALQPSEGVKLRHGGKDVLVLRRASVVMLRRAA
ncbi:hypothetical protein Landi51_00863 [Colletotrichum acutatum]